MRRSRPDPAAAGARLAAVLPSAVVGGWVPPPLREPSSEPDADPEQVDEEVEVEVGRSWTGQQSLAQSLSALVPAGLRGGRWDPGRRGVGALAVVALIGAIGAGFVVLRARPHEVPSQVPAAAAASAPVAGGPLLVVDVAGKVRHPGIVRLPFGSRVDDAVRAAGGPLPGASFEGLNRARKLADGEQVLVGVPAAAGGAAGGPAAGDGRVDINLADVAALDGLPGIGPVLAQKIVDWRTEHGRFASIDQLREVGGIGESKYAAVKNKVRV